MSYAGCACYWLEPTGRVRLSLRRFTFSVSEGDEDDGRHHDCPEGESGCDASVELVTFLPLRFDDGEYGRTMREVPRSARPLARDPRWPDACEHCREPFPRRAMRQVNQAEEYRRSDSDTLVYMRRPYGEENAGALLDGWWLHRRLSEDGQGYVGPDGIALIAICPNGYPWELDGPATGGGRWTRTGDPRDPPSLTVSPSIAIVDPASPKHYHGFLQAGSFTDG